MKGAGYRLSLLALLAATLGGCALFDDDDVVKPEPLPETVTLEAKPIWTESIGSGLGDGFSRLTPAIVDNKLYAADYEGEVQARDASNGASIWDIELKSDANPLPPSSWYEFWKWFRSQPHARTAGAVGVGGGLVLVGTLDAEVIALDAETGAEKWRNLVSSEVIAPPVYAEGKVLVRTNDGKLFALDAETGKRSWIYDRSVPVLSLRGTSAPTSAHGAAIASFDSGKVAAILLQDGRPIWEKTVAAARGRNEFDRVNDVDADPLVADDVVYAVGYHGQVVALDLRSGETLWQRELSAYEPIGIDADNLYVVDDESVVRAIDRRSGATIWSQSELKHRDLTGAAAYGDFIAAGDAEGYVHFLSRTDGHYLGRYEVDSDGIVSQPVVAGDKLYVYARNGELAAFKLP